MNNKLKWIDFKALERDDVDENFGLFDYLIFGSRWVAKRWWWMLIPPLNLFIAISCIVAFVTIPFRWYISSKQLRDLRQNAYDIEDTIYLFRLIRNTKGDIGLCEWGESYELSRKVLLKSQYANIERLAQNAFIVTDKSNKVGLYDANDYKWLFPCSCDSIDIESNEIINVTIGNKSQRYNLKGDRILN